MLIEHRGKKPRVDETAWVAPNATICGDVTIGPDCRVLFGAVITAEGGSVTIGARCIVMENAVVRATTKHATVIGDHTLIGPHAHVSGASIGDSVFVATGATVFNGARLGPRSEVRVNGIVHVNSAVLPDVIVPIGWVAVGDPARLFPPDAHDEIWAIQSKMGFARTVFDLEPAPDGESLMPQITRRYARGLRAHEDDRPGLTT